VPELVDERAHFMRCPYCDEFFDMRELSEVTLHYDFSLTMSSDGTVTVWPILGHPPPGLRNSPGEIAWLEEFHGAKSEPGVIPRWLRGRHNRPELGQNIS
jgi:hypothetical protein